MRGKLKKLTSNDRHIFTATVGRFGTKTNYNGFPEPTILLKSIKLDNKQLCDHLWFTVGKRFADLQLSEGDTIQFKARVGSYRKGYWGKRETDYCLKYPTDIQKLNKAA